MVKIFFKKLKDLLSDFLCLLIKLYQKYISPLHRPCCRFIPTCSTYALEAIKKYGSFKGTFLAIKRILKCNPFNECGYDPVP